MLDTMTIGDRAIKTRWVG